MSTWNSITTSVSRASILQHFKSQWLPCPMAWEETHKISHFVWSCPQTPNLSQRSVITADARQIWRLNNTTFLPISTFHHSNLKKYLLNQGVWNIGNVALNSVANIFMPIHSYVRTALQDHRYRLRLILCNSVPPWKMHLPIIQSQMHLFQVTTNYVLLNINEKLMGKIAKCLWNYPLIFIQLFVHPQKSGWTKNISIRYGSLAVVKCPNQIILNKDTS